MGRQKTHEEFVKEVFELVHDEYTVESRYQKSQIKIDLRHNKCEKVWNVVPNSFLKGKRCPYCSGRFKKNTKYYIEEVEQLVGNTYTVLGEYKGAHPKVKMRHNECGYIFDMSPTGFLSGRRCPDCGGTRKKTHKEFSDEVFELVGDEYEVLTEYKTNRDSICLRHNHDFCNNNEYTTTPTSFLRGSRCHVCSEEKRRISQTTTNEEFQSKLLQTYKGKTTTEDPFVTTKTPLRFTHEECGRTFEASPEGLFQNKQGCYLCTLEKRVNKLRKSHQEFEEEIFSLVGDEYSILGTYETTSTKIKMRHNNESCSNHVFYMKPYGFIGGSRCPRCNFSKGEQRIGAYLDNLNIRYEGQYKIKECKHVQVLPFDFGIINDKNELITLIEYDGKQHFDPVQFGGMSLERAVEELNITKRNDNIKSQYCKDNNIPLLRIPYWDFDNIESILHNELLKHNIIKEEMIVS